MAEPYRKPIPKLTPNDEARFWSLVNTSPGQGPWGNCLTFQNTEKKKGYGVFNIKGKAYMAHRVSYTQYAGPIPAGKDTDHLCRIRNCINVAHLDPVTNRENIFRGTGVGPTNTAKTHCIQGHPFSPENTYRGKRGRACITCRKLRTADKARVAKEQGVRYAPTKTHCAHGHPLTPDNVFHNLGRPRCKTCNRENLRKRTPTQRRGYAKAYDTTHHEDNLRRARESKRRRRLALKSGT